MGRGCEGGMGRGCEGGMGRRNGEGLCGCKGGKIGGGGAVWKGNG